MGVTGFLEGDWLGFSVVGNGVGSAVILLVGDGLGLLVSLLMDGAGVIGATVTG